MKHRELSPDLFGISLMYDAVLFVVMVSIAGVILLPALENNMARESSLDAHREQVVDQALHTFLVTRADSFDYTVFGSLIDDVAGRIGIDNSSDGLYASLTHWLLAHEQRHKTYGTLLAENLGCQFQVPFSLFGSDQVNIFTDDYDRQLRNQTKCFFSSLFGKKYEYNLTAWWHPIKGIPFGGRFSVGAQAPLKDSYVARNFFMMPFSPVFTLGNRTIIFTKYWMKHQLFDTEVGFGRSSIPAVANMTIVFENYTNKHPPYDSKEIAKKSLKENLSYLVYGFLIDGIVNESNVTVFPGIVPLTLSYGFEKLRNITKQHLNQAVEEIFGDAIRAVDRVFGSLNTSVVNPISQSILFAFNSTFCKMLNGSFGSLNETIHAFEQMVKEKITVLLRKILAPLIESFVDIAIDVVEMLRDFIDMLIDWLFDRVSLNTAEVMLTIWVVRE
jgi:hypothetical protein